MNSRLVALSGVRSQSPYQSTGYEVCRRQQPRQVIEIDEAYAAVAHDRLVGIDKPIVVGEVHDPRLRIGRRVEELLDPPVICRGDGSSSVGRPGEPGLPRRIAAFEGEPAIVGQVIMGGSQDGDGIVVAQQRLEGMTRHVDEVEALGQTQRLALGLDPGDPPGAWTRSGHAEHALGRIGAGNGEPLLGDAAGQQPGAASEVEHPATDLQGQRQVEVVADVPGIEMVVERGEQGILEHLVDVSRHRRPV